LPKIFRRLAAPIGRVLLGHDAGGDVYQKKKQPHSLLQTSNVRVVEGSSWMKGVHFTLASLRRSLGFWVPPHMAASTGASAAAASSPGATRNGTGGQFGLDSSLSSPPADDLLLQVADESEEEAEDREIVSDMQAMEWAMWPALAIGMALVCTSICSICTSATPRLQSVILAIRFAMNLASSACVISMLSWSARHRRSDCEKEIALVGILAFFADWLILASGLQRYVYFWRPHKESKPQTGTAYTFRPKSVYANALRPTSEPFAYFGIQSLLMWLYVAGVHKKARELGVDATSGDAVATRVFFWWLLSAGVQLHMTEQMGSGFVDNMGVWGKLWDAARERRRLRGNHQSSENSSECSSPHRELSSSQEQRPWTMDELVLRMSMDFIVNCVYYNLMYMSVPVLLVASKQPLELVMNAFAVTYILTLDDEKDSPRISILETDSDSATDAAAESERQIIAGCPARDVEKY
jgi:hypothetical protein